MAKIRRSDWHPPERTATVVLLDDDGLRSEAFIDQLLDDAKAAYEGGDAFAPWQAFSLCRTVGREIPSWVLEYLARAADRICLKIRPGAPQRQPGKLPTLLARALGFTRDGAPKIREWRAADLVRAVTKKVDAAGGPRQASMKAIYNDVAAEHFGSENARLGKGVRAVQSAWRQRRQK
jgi:hypothetical protein